MNVTVYFCAQRRLSSLPQGEAMTLDCKQDLGNLPENLEKTAPDRFVAPA
jgi:hypothetical protein